MIRNTSESWGWPARILHWLIALMVLGLFAFGLWMVDVAPRRERPYYFAILTFATPIVGWLMSGTFEHPLEPKVFGLFPVPQLLAAASPYHELLTEMHETLAFALIGLVGVHAAAALYHHFVLRDSVLRRMVSDTA